MSNLKQEAEAYTTPKTLNVADLEELSLELEIETRDFTDGEDKPFSIEVVSIDGEDYRVPKSVIKQIKAILEAKPDVKKVKVTKDGEGLNTSYQVIPL